ncbi:hypothetical protein A9Q94_18580 [Rhodobacterales bacterium 56_14_T64]|nr:hypothetical protein A9Q94_18580 [Rhodobacterales bacterium 56_14_T64]
MAVNQVPNSDHSAPRKLFFLLLPEFSLLSLCSALEPLRIANRIAERTLFDWELCAEDQQLAQSSLGISIPVLSSLPAVTNSDTVFVCGGTNVEKTTSKRTLNWLRKAARQGAVIGGLCTGTYILAVAGLMTGKRATIHWENQDSLAELFPDVVLTKSAFVVDGNRMSTAGGVASIGMMLDYISTHEGPDLAHKVSEQLMYSHVRRIQFNSTTSAPDRGGISHPKLKRAIQAMDDNLENPLSVVELAKFANVSVRQLERIFKRFLSQPPVRYYTEMRLQRAHNMLLQTDLPVLQISLACGFKSTSVFAMRYKQRFGLSPHQALRASQSGE